MNFFIHLFNTNQPCDTLHTLSFNNTYTRKIGLGSAPATPFIPIPFNIIPFNLIFIPIITLLYLIY